MFVGYARVSAYEDSLGFQKEALTCAGCEKIFTDSISRAAEARPGIMAALDYLRPGDTLVVLRLDRLARTIRHLLELVIQLEKRSIEIKSLEDSIDTSKDNEKSFFHIIRVFAGFERNLLKERTMTGLSQARARGKKGGRHKILSEEKSEKALSLYREKKHTIQEICRIMNISKPTLYNYLRRSTEKGAS